MTTPHQRGPLFQIPKTWSLNTPDTYLTLAATALYTMPTNQRIRFPTDTYDSHTREFAVETIHKLKQIDSPQTIGRYINPTTLKHTKN